MREPRTPTAVLLGRRREITLLTNFSMMPPIMLDVGHTIALLLCDNLGMHLCALRN